MINQLAKFVAKDFIIQKKSLKTYILMSAIMAIFFSITNANQPSMIIAVFAFLIIYSFINKALYEDEKNNTLRFLVSLPMKREIIVYGRYISVGLMIIIVTLTLLVLDRVLIAAGVWKMATGMSSLIIMVIVYAFIIMVSVYLPLAFKLGYIKAVGINKFIFIGMFAIFGALGIAAGSIFKGNPPEFLGRLDAFLSSLDAGVVGFLFGIIILIIYAISMKISIRFFRKRDLFK